VTPSVRWRPDREGTFTGICLGAWAVAVALVPEARIKLALLAPVAAVALTYWLLGGPMRWLAAFVFAAILLPPLPLPGGDSGLSIAPLLAGFGLLSSLIWLRCWRPPWHPVTGALVAFAGALLASLAFALVYSGWRIALGSFARVGLFCISILVFLYAYAGPRPALWNELRFARYLYGLAIAAAVFACADFYFQFPVPAGFGNQFIWLQDAVLRRAQGLFYEASTLGNFCAFFLVMTAVTYIRTRRESPLPRMILFSGGLILAAALVLSYSRASMVNVAVAIAALGFIRLQRLRRSIFTAAGVLVLAAFAIHTVNPELSDNYWGRLLGSFSFFFTTPDKILSGRLSSWSGLADFLTGHPWHVLFGIGYKTLPYSSFTGGPIVADNTYLALLVETGVPGLVSFVALNILILRTGWRALQSADSTTAFLGEWIFCFWCGQVVQMLSGDLITYWRVLPVYFWVLGAAARGSRDA